MSQWPHIFKQMVEISLLISVSCCALVPLCFGLGVWNYTCREKRLKVTLDPGRCLAAGSLPLAFISWFLVGAFCTRPFEESGGREVSGNVPSKDFLKKNKIVPQE